MKYLGCAEAIVVLDGPLQHRLREGVVVAGLVAVEKDRVEVAGVVFYLKKII